MDITFTLSAIAGTIGTGRLVEFLTAHEIPFHASRRPARGVVEGWIDDGRFGDADHASFWIDTDAGRIGLVVLKDLRDDAPLFDLRLATEYRGNGFGIPTRRRSPTAGSTSARTRDRYG